MASAGYIINNFFDAAKDQINRPKKISVAPSAVPRRAACFIFFTQLVCCHCSSFCFFKVVLFFGAYSLAIYAYSLFLKRLYWISNWAAAFLILLPFYVITLHYNNQDTVLYGYASYFYLLLLCRDLIKDLENFKGDFAQRYQTLPIVFGQRPTKAIISLLIVLAVLPLFFLFTRTFGQTPILLLLFLSDPVGTGLFFMVSLHSKVVSLAAQRHKSYYFFGRLKHLLD